MKLKENFDQRKWKLYITKSSFPFQVILWSLFWHIINKFINLKGIKNNNRHIFNNFYSESKKAATKKMRDSQEKLLIFFEKNSFNTI